MDNRLVLEMKSDFYDISVNQIRPGNDPDRLYEVIRIVEKESEKTVVSAFYCKNAYKLYGQHFFIRQLDDEELGIIFDDLHLSLVASRQNVFEAMLMHEVGHMVNKHFDIEKSSDEVMRERCNFILLGKVDPNELSADRFAVEHCGKNAVMQMLDHLISIRKERNTVDGSIAIREMELRKKAIMRL